MRKENDAVIRKYAVVLRQPEQLFFGITLILGIGWLVCRRLAQ